MTAPRLRVLFCLATTALSGGVKMVFEIASRLQARGHIAEILAFAGPPRWWDLGVPLLASRDFSSIDPARYDVVFATNAFMVPLLWPRVAPARLVFYAQDYESFHHGPGGTYADFAAESRALRAVYELPVPIITEAVAVQRLIRERTRRQAWYAPVGLNRAVFREQPRVARDGRRRVLFVGNYLMPYKGMRDGFAAVATLARDLDVEVVLATQEHRERTLFEQYPFATEIHWRPPEPAMPAIFASADVFCCASWYEGLGLPALEAFACGVPVVSTRTYGVDEYGVDGDNLLLARAHDPGDLAASLRRVLTDAALAARLREGGLATVRERYHWDEGIDRFEDALGEIAATPPPPLPPAPVLAALAARLERDGCFTPLEHFQRHERLMPELDAACAALAAGPEPGALARVRAIRDEIAPLITNPTAQYYRAFRAQYDLCQLVLGLEHDPRLPGVLAARRCRTSAHATNPASSLREVRYLE